MNKLKEKKNVSRLKLQNKKGFTLVEVIVVLVILAILAAILVPSMIGWIKKAEKKTAIAEAKQVYTASQIVLTEKYGEKAVPSGIFFNISNSVTTEPGKEIASLAEMEDGCSAQVVFGKVMEGKNAAEVFRVQYKNKKYMVTFYKYAANGVPNNNWNVTEL